MISEYIPIHPGTDDYDTAPRAFDLKHPAKRGIVAGEANRCGITPPGFRLFATYRITTGWAFDERLYEPGTYVYEQGRFFESRAWREHEVAAGRYPVAQPAKKGKRV